MWSNKANADSVGMLPGRKTFGPLFLMVATTTFVVLFWFTQEHFNGSLMEMLNYILENGIVFMVVSEATLEWYQHRSTGKYWVTFRRLSWS